jgi:RHS repeat-associated protein
MMTLNHKVNRWCGSLRMFGYMRVVALFLVLLSGLLASHLPSASAASVSAPPTPQQAHVTMSHALATQPTKQGRQTSPYAGGSNVKSTPTAAKGVAASLPPAFPSLRSPKQQRPGLSGSYTIAALKGVAVLVAIAGEYNTSTCALIDDGQYTTVIAPTEGTLSYDTEPYTFPPGYNCAGVTIPANVARYTWTANNGGKTPDSFEITWITSDGQFYFDNAYTAGLTQPQPGKYLGCPCNAGGGTGEPISIASGNVFEQVSDYATTGANTLGFTRYYNSRALPTAYAVSLGSNWRSTYDRYLDIMSGSSVTAERDNGQVLQFTLNGSVWTSNSDVDVKLTNSGNTWTLTDSNDNVETYTQGNSGEALLNTLKARNGYTQTLTYNKKNQLTLVTDSFNRKLSLTYSGTLLQTVTTPDGLVLTYGYRMSGLHSGVLDELASVTYSTNPTTSQTYYYLNYGLYFQLIDIVDENGNTYQTWKYDNIGRGLSSQSGSGADLTSVAYDYSTGNRTVTNALGQQSVYKYAILQRVPKVIEIDRLATQTVQAATETFTYDSKGYVASKTDWNGVVTHYVNDVHGQPTSITEAVGTPQARTTTITYDNVFVHLPDKIVAPHLTTSFMYDSNGNVLTSTETDTSGGSTNGQTHIWTNTYDSFGHVLTATDPRTDVKITTTYTYTKNNLSTVTDALGHVSHITSYNHSGLPLSMTDANGVVTTFTYDARERLLTRTIQAASGNATTTLGYDAAGDLTSITLPNNSQLLYTYDTAHRVIMVQNNLNEQIDYTLNANGDITRQQILNSSSTLTKTQSAVFDSLGRTLQQMGASGQTTTFAYDANNNLVSIQNPPGNTTAQAFDALNRLIKSTDPLTNTTNYAYNSQDNVTGVTAPRTLTTNYVYDGFGHVIQQSSPDTGTTSYTLDEDGNRVKETDARGIVTNRTFDKLNRVLTETYPASASENIAYTYDANGSGNFGIGHLTGFTDESGSTAFTYNERGDVITDSSIIGGKSYLTRYAYDLADNVLSVTYPSGHIITYTGDAFGRIASASYKPSGQLTLLASGVSYEPFGPSTGFTYGNKLVNTIAYDLDYRETGITTSGNIQNLALGYDSVNNITSITDALDSTRNQTFGYDKDNRLTNAVGKYGTLGYTYDADGNRLSMTSNGVTSTYTYPSASNQLASVKTGTATRKFTYTANGNIATDTRGKAPDATFTYSNRNRNQQVTITGGSTTTYTYNALGERVSKTAGSVITQYIYDPNGHLIAESNGQTSAISREYVWMDDLPLAQIESNGTIYYIHTDQLNTPQKLTNASGKLVRDRIQEPFGETVSIKGSAIDNLRFPGQYADSESGLNQNGMRDYDPTLSRYIEADPIGLRGGINLYAYVGENPVNWVDPNGTDAKSTVTAICLMIGLCNVEHNYTPPNTPSQQQEQPAVPNQQPEQSVWKPKNPIPQRQTPCPAQQNLPASGNNPTLSPEDAAVAAEANYSIPAVVMFLIIFTPSEAY